MRGAEGGRTRLIWDAQGRLAGHESADGRATRYTRDSAGRPETRTDPRGGKVVQEYDTRSRLVALRNENGETYRFVWGENDRLVEEHGLEGTITRYGYDECVVDHKIRTLA